MKAKIVVTEDTVSEYFKRIAGEAKSERNSMLNEMAHIFTTDVYELAPHWQDALAESGFEESNWEICDTSKGGAISVLYTGLYNAVSWWEFSDDGDTNHPPDRDYAYFQETGIDPIADSSDAKHKGFISSTLRRSDTRHNINMVAQEYLKRILNG